MNVRNRGGRGGYSAFELNLVLIGFLSYIEHFPQNPDKQAHRSLAQLVAGKGTAGWYQYAYIQVGKDQ